MSADAAANFPEGFQLRSATNEDCSEVQILVFSVLAEYGLKADPKTVDADLYDLEGHYIQRGGCFDVVTDSTGKIVASIGLQPQEAGEAELRKMYVQSSVRGLGIGKLLLKHALLRAEALHLTAIHLETASILKEAVRMYERAGFQLYSPDHHAERSDAAYRLRL